MRETSRPEFNDSFDSYHDIKYKVYNVTHGYTTVLTLCDVLLKDRAPSPPSYRAELRYFITAILTVFPVFTVLGNAMIIAAVVTHKRLRTVTNAFVVSLATSDFMVALLVMPFGIYQQFNDNVWLLGQTLCLVTTSFDVMFTTTSILNLSCLAIDRYLAICKPFVHERLDKKKVGLMLAFCWIVPVFISFFPILQGWNLNGIEDYVKCAFPPSPSEGNHCVFVVNAGFAIVCSSIAFYIPTIFIIICNFKIYMTAQKQAHQIRRLSIADHRHHRKGKLKHETKAAKTVGIIMGCFFLCWFPFFSLNIIDPIMGYKIPYVPWIVALWLGYINSMLNPVLYYKFNRHYKMAFRCLLKNKVCRGIIANDDSVIPSAVYTSVLAHSKTNENSVYDNNNYSAHNHLNNIEL